MNVVIPMAGRGSRFSIESDKNPEYKKPKPLINIAGVEMIQWTTSSLNLEPSDNFIFLILKEHVDEHSIDKRLKEIYGNNVKIIVVDQVTNGPACTVLLAKEHINNDEPMIITDCDHLIDGDAMIKDAKKYGTKIDGLIPVFYANNLRFSFSRTDEEGLVIEVLEKTIISRNANAGVYYFRKGRDFVWAAEEMIDENDRANGEFYVAPVYNYLIRRGKKIRLCRPKFFHGIGTPKEIEKFLDFLKRGEIETKIRFSL